MKIEKVKIIDCYAIKTFHEVVNYSFIMICRKIFKEVVYLSGKDARDNIQNFIISKHGEQLSNVYFKNIWVYRLDSSIGSLIRIILGVFTTIFHYLITPYNTFIFYNYTNPLSLPLILLFNIFLRKKILFVFHGELELLTKKIPINKVSYWYTICNKISFKFLINKSPAYILVLGDSIKTNLLNIYPQISEHILSICHPYILDKGNTCINDHSLKPLRIGTVGVMTTEKGFDSLIRLSLLLKSLIDQNKLELFCIGKVHVKCELPNNIHWIGYEDVLPREEFEAQIRKLDYFLYLYPVDSYKLIASGAIMDAVKLHKPIIALQNDYFQYLMGDNPIGYLRQSIDELAEVIIKLLHDGDMMNNFEDEFDILAKKISIENNAKLLEEQLERIL